MKVKVSSKGQVIIPVQIRRQFDIRTGDLLNVHLDGEAIILTPRKSGKRKARIVTDPITGLPVLTLGPDAPMLTSKNVEEMLGAFP